MLGWVPGDSPLARAGPLPVHLRGCCRASNYAYWFLFLSVRKVTVPRLWLLALGWLGSDAVAREAQPVLEGIGGDGAPVGQQSPASTALGMPRPRVSAGCHED